MTLRFPLQTALAAALLSLGLAGAQAQTTLKVIPHADLRNIDPIWTTAYITRNHGYMIFDTLFAMDENLQPRPQMVDTWEVSDDGLVWTFTLRDGLLWHDGNPVTAADCVASLRRWGARDGMGQQLMAVTAELEALDDQTLRLTLSEPYGLVLESIGKISSNVPFMMPEWLAATDPFEQIPESIGSGPFKFVKEEWVPGSRVVYVKNEAYLPRDEPVSAASGGKIAKVDRVEWHYIPDPQTAMNALINGEVDYYENAPPDLVPLLEQSPDLVVDVLDPLGNQGMLRLNHLWPPFDNKDIRHAVLWAMNQEMYMQAAVGNPDFYSQCYSFYPCGTVFATDAGTEPLREYNPDKARELLAAAGYNNEPVVILQPTDIPVTNAASLVTAQLLRDIGMNVQLQAMDWSTVTSRRAIRDAPTEGGWNIFHTWWIGGDIFNPVIATGLSGGGVERAWFGWPNDPELEAMRAAFARESDPERQKQLAEDIQLRAFDTVTHGNFGTWFNPVAYRNNISGLIPSPVQFFWNVEKQ